MGDACDIDADDDGIENDNVRESQRRAVGGGQRASRALTESTPLSAPGQLLARPQREPEEQRQGHPRRRVRQLQNDGEPVPEGHRRGRPGRRVR